MKEVFFGNETPGKSCKCLGKPSGKFDSVPVATLLLGSVQQSKQVHKYIPKVGG